MNQFYVEPGKHITLNGTVDAFGLKCLINRYFFVKRHISKIERFSKDCSICNEIRSLELAEERAKYIARRYELENVLALFGVDAQSLDEE
jgi:hypothetical protein